MRAVRVARLGVMRRYGAAVLTALGGAYVAITADVLRDFHGMRSIWTLAVLVAALFLAFAARSPYVITFEWDEGLVTWKPSFLIGTSAGRDANEMIERIVDAARRVGVVVVDDRSAA